MTELQQRAIEYTEKNMGTDFHIPGLLVGFVEQETKLLSKHILELQADKGKLTDEIKELKENKLVNVEYQLEGRELVIKELTQLIEKMKCCGNCMGQSFRMLYCTKCTNKSEWRLAE